jgi:aspartate-semialdehyde dehydrogenase
MNIAVVGVTGMVGQVMLRVLEERNLEITTLIPVASEKSVGTEITFKGKQIKVVSMEDAIAMKPHIALFSAGGSVSLEFAPQFAAAGTTVIDNSSAFRMQANTKLIVPEINASTLTRDDKIIANPNCSTIQLVMAMAPLHRAYGIKRLVISTYQSITGTGVKAVEQLDNEMAGKQGALAYHYPIHRNAIPACDVFEDNGYTKEELKLVNETQKILNDNSIGVTATAVRIPVVGGHSESLNIALRKEFNISDIRKLLAATEGITVQDNPDTNTYPMPLMAQGKDAVFVGRIRRDLSQENTLNMWIVADNLRKGAATNAVQIAQYLIANKIVS